MGRLEETLRETFHRRAAVAPPLENLADRAIRAGRRIRRRHTVLASTAAAVCVGLVGFGAAAVTNRNNIIDPAASTSPTGTFSTAGPTTSPQPGPRPVDVIIDSTLYRADGGQVSLGSIASCEGCRVEGAWRVDGGWLVEVHQSNEAPAADQSTLYRVSGSPTVVVVGTSIVVSPGTRSRPGIQVAWAAPAEGLLSVGTYSDGLLSGVADTPMPYAEAPPGVGGDPWPLYPVAVAGDAVVLAGTRAGDGLDASDAWFPALGAFVAEGYPLIRLHSTTVDGERIIAWHYRFPDSGSTEACLGELSPEGFAVVRSRCPTPFQDHDRIYPSPDGRWWMVGTEQGMTLYDADEVWDEAGPVRTWPGTVGGGVWLDEGAAFVTVLGDGTVLTIHLDGEPDETTAPPGSAAGSPILITDLR